ncbi:sugar ABC transporter ATP-binding protein [Flavitalea antarctica]
MLKLRNISKFFGGVKALQDVSIDFNSGEVHVLCGENGAGKSTLMNIIMGNLQPDQGKIFRHNQQVTIDNVLSAQRLGLSIVYQEGSLANALSIAENIFPVNMPLTGTGLINYTGLYNRTALLLADLGLSHLDPKMPVIRLSVAQKRMVEIAKAIAQDPALLILDEPTASLTYSETAILFRIIANLKKKGTGIIYISHRMEEIREIARKISVLKDGKLVGTVDSSVPTQDIIRMMVGRNLEAGSEESCFSNDIKLEVRNLTGKGFSNISFQLRRGEILGFAGLEGSGRSAMAKAIFGYEIYTRGTITMDGRQLNIHHPAEALKEKIVYLPEDRKTESLFYNMSVAENIFAAQLQSGFYNEREINRNSRILCDEFNVRSPMVTQPVRTLSGGNQQKVVLAKCLALKPEVLIINEPTHGVDAGAKSEIYPQLKKLTREGKSIILISSELKELLLLCDRIAVMHKGKIIGILNHSEATEEKITILASGYKN